MELQEIDGLIGRYSAAETRILANLVELDDHATFRLLRDAPLSGETARLLGDAMAGVAELWSDLARLQDHLAAVRAKRAEGRWVSAADRTALAAMLVGDVVETDVLATPLGERGLLDEAVVEQRIGLDALIDRMRVRYEPIRDGVARVDALWRSVLPGLDAASATLGRLRDELASLGIGDPVVDSLEDEVARLRALLVDDPLALDVAAAERLDRQTTAAAAHVAGLRDGHDALDADLVAVERLLAEIRSLRATAAAAASETRAKVARPGTLVAVPEPGAVDGPGGLASRLDTLRAMTGPWLERRRSLDGLLDTCRRLRDQLARALATNRAPLDQRDALRGQLKAYRAKAAAGGRAEDAVVLELTDEIHNELYTAPADLARAQSLLGALAATLAPVGSTR